MITSLFALALVLPQGPGSEQAILRVGETFAGEITDAEAAVHTPTLDKGYTDAPVVGRSLLLEVDEPGTYTLELRSYLFDAYLVLRDESGALLAEDDDGLIGTHSRIVVELEPGIRPVDVCALHGQRGAFELRLLHGRPVEVAPRYRDRAEREELERALAIREEALGPEHQDTATSLNSLAVLLYAQGDYAAARPLLERALAIRGKALGPEHPLTALSLNNLAALLRDQGDYAAARPLSERALAIREKALGPEHQDTALSLNNLALLLQAQGDYAAARPLYERALAISEKALGPEHQDTALSLNNLAALLYAQGDYAAARPLYERALAICEKALGPEHKDTAASLNNLALLLQAQGDYAAARPLYERALAISEKALGPEHQDTATSLNSLALLLQAEGDYAAARPLLERALAICEKALGPEHQDTARSLNNLAGLLEAQGDYAAARPLYERAIAIREKVLGPEHQDTATSLHNLAGVLRAQGDYTAARPLYERALAIFEKALGPEHQDTATSLNSLAVLLRAQGDYAAARPLLERALAILEKALGPEHPYTAKSLNNLAAALYAQGDYAAARPLYERALAIWEKALGPEHPNTAEARSNLGTLLADLGSLEESTGHAQSALRARVRHAEKTLWSLSERERLSYLGLGAASLRGCLSDFGRSALPESYELALAWRGLVSRSLLASRARLRASLPAGAVAAIDRLSGVQAELSKRLYASEIPDRERHEREIRDLRERRNALEVEVQRLGGPSLARAPKLTELEQGLAPSEAFLDFLVHPFYRPAEREGERVVRKGEWSEDHLSAWVVRNGRTLAHVDLGPAAPIEAAARAWLSSVVSDAPLVAARGIGVSAQAGVASEDGHGLSSLLWEPLAEHLAGVTRVFVRPDSFLGTLPLGILTLAGGRYLIEDVDFVYVQAPDDIVGERDHSSPSSLVAIGGVDFARREALARDSTSAATLVASAAMTDGLRGRVGRSWSRLPHTEIEVQTVRGLFERSFPDGDLLFLTADQPSEERLKRELPRHAYVHLATHGFFHPAGTVSLWDSAREAAAKDARLGLEQETRGLVGELPGLLSGLVCAGANEPAPLGRDDGLLTAEEVLWLDLSKVELVVLSACETALGERRAGEGMIGLRRAFGLAGAKTVVSSLWSVKDRSTSDLMRAFYENLLLKGQGRAEALRNAQLAMLAANRASEGDALPSTWGPFVLSGEWR